jgi:hypothetical protein
MRRFFRFSVRDLLWITLVVGLALGWWIDRQRLRADLQADVDRANKLATTWKMAAQAVGETLTDDIDGSTIQWDVEKLQVIVLWPKRADGFVRHQTFSIDPANAPLVYEFIDKN